MADTINIKFKVLEDGSLQGIGTKAEKASKGLDKTSKSARNTDRNLRGVAGMSSNTTKNFSKMQQGLSGGLVPAYAALAANVFAVTAAFGVLSRAAGVKQLTEGLLFTGRAAGQNLSIVTDNLREITDNAISSADAMRALAIGTSAGFSESQMEGLTKVAKGASLALGRDMTDALDRLTRGAAKLEPEILDELGIIVRLDRVTEDYAASLGIATSELSEFDRRMAFTNAIVEQGNRKFGALAEAIDVNPFNQLAATFDDLIKTVVNFLNEALGPLASFLASSMPAMVGSIAVLGGTVVRQMVPGINDAAAGMRDLAKETSESAKKSLGFTKTFKGAPKIFDSLTEKIRDGEASSKDFVKAQTSLTRSIEIHEKQMPEYIKSHGKGSEAVAKKTQKLNAAKTALAQLTVTQQLETQATLAAGRADVMASASAGNLIATLRLLKAQLLAEYAATLLNVKGKGIMAVTYGIAAFAAKGLTFSIMALGVALFAAIPVIGAIVAAGYAMYEMFKGYFGIEETVSPLKDVLEEGKERFEEYPNIINQMGRAYASATSDLDRYIVSMTAYSGIISQTAAQINKLRTVEEIQRVRQRMEAKRQVKEAQEKLAAAKAIVDLVDDSKRARNLVGSTSGPGTDISHSDYTTAKTNVETFSITLASAEAALVSLGEKTGPSLDRMAGTQVALERAITATEESLRELRESGAGKNAEEIEGMSETLVTLRGLLDNFSEETLDNTITVLDKLDRGLKKTNQAFKELGEISSDVSNLIAKNDAPTGKFTEQIKIFEKAVKAISGTNANQLLDTATLESLNSLGFVDDAADGKILTSLNNHLTKIKEINEEIKKRKLAEAQLVDSNRKFLVMGNKSKALEEDMNYLTELRTALENEKNLKSKESTDLIEEELALLKNAEAIEKKRLEIIQNRLDLTNRATGGDASGFGEAGAELDTIFNDPKFDREAFGAKNLAEQLYVVQDALNPIIEGFKKLGPEGEAMAAALSGMMQIVNVMQLVKESFKEMNITSGAEFKEAASGAEGLEKQIGAIAGATAAVASGFVALFSTMKAATEQRIKGVDREIAAEKARDGQSEQSQARIKALEDKKEKLKKKAFEQDKKAKMAQVVMATSLAIMQAVALLGPFGLPVAAMFAAMGAAQLAMISGMQYEGGGKGTAATPTSDVSVGQRSNTVDLARGNNQAGEISYMRGEQGVGGATNFRPAFMGYKNRAAGGYIVGEQGPELFMPEVPGEIIPSGQGMGQNVTANFNIQALDAAGVEEILLQQQNHIIGMIRSAANDHGEFFLESVDTGVSY